MIRNGREPVIQDVFSQMKLFFPLLGFGIAVFILIMMGLMMFILPGILISLAISFICLYMLPLMTDKQKGIIEALKESFAITTDKEKFSDHLIVAILITGIYMVGGYTYIGWIFTLPFSTVFLMLIYEEQVNRMPMQPMYQAEPPEQNNA
jgi:membrane-anchored glycerophosphoryl diester phosphodiesterase (GDPDase)